MKNQLNNYFIFFFFFSILLISFHPYLLNNFGYHNDFTVWEYDNKDCCMGFVENPHLFNIGRYLQTFLQGFFLSYFSHVEDFKIGRLIAIFFSAINCLLFFNILKKYSLNAYFSFCLATLFILLPASQLNHGIITNFVPGIFNLSLILISVYFFPLTNLSLKNIVNFKFFVSFLFLILTIINYPPFSGLFLLPAFYKCICYGFRASLKFILFNSSIYIIAILLFFVFHKFVFIYFYEIESIPAGSLYNFNIAGINIFFNLYKFFSEIFPVFFSLSFPIINIYIILLVLLAVILSIKKQFNNEKNSKNYLLEKYIAILFIFLFSNLTTLGYASPPPLYLRLFYPTAIFFTLFLMIHLDYLVKSKFKIYFYLSTILVFVLSSYFISNYLSKTLSFQLTYSEKQINEQLKRNEDAKGVFIFEYRPKNNLSRFDLFGEFSTILILSQGHLNYLIKKNKFTKAPPLFSHIHFNKDHYYWLSKKYFDIINPKKEINYDIENSKIRLNLKGTVKYNIDNNKEISSDSFPLDNIFDNIYYTFWETKFEDNVSIEFNSLNNENNFKCIEISSGDHYEYNRMPKNWEVYEYREEKWQINTIFNDQNKWQNIETRKYVLKDKIRSNKIKIKFNSVYKGNIFRIYNLDLVTC